MKPYYEKNGIVLYNGKSEDVLPLIESDRIDLIVTSPPYGNIRTYNGFKWDFETIARELYRVTKVGGVCVWVVGDQTVNGSESGDSFRQALGFMGAGFFLHDTMIYDKGGVTHPSPNRYHQCFEFMFVFSKGVPKTTNLIEDRINRWANHKGFGTSRARQVDGSLKVKEKRRIKEVGVRYNIWRYVPGYGYSSKDEEAYEHPAIFPEDLAADHIRSWSNEGDTVLDCFAGSGTTPKAATLLKRKCIGIEISEQYCDLIKRRLNPPMPLFDTTQP